MKPNYKKIYSIVREKFEKTQHFRYGPFDETYYTLRVYETAKELCKHYKKANKEIVLTAALLHDIGKTKLKSSILFGNRFGDDQSRTEWKTHGTKSVPIAGRILNKLGHSDEFISKVSFLIANHDQPTKGQCIELKILVDADLIADAGFAGFIRPFLWAGKFKRGIIESIQYMQHKENRRFAMNKISLPYSKVLAKEKLKTENELVKIISKDIKSDVLQ